MSSSSSSSSDNSINSRNKPSSPVNLDARYLTFPVQEDGSNVLVKDSKEETGGGDSGVKLRQLPREEIERMENKKRIGVLKQTLGFENLPDDPIYRQIDEDLLDLNEINEKDMGPAIRIMINVALSDYVVIRKIIDSEMDQVENIKYFFKMVDYEDYNRYHEVQSELEHDTRMIDMIRRKEDVTIESYEKIRELEKRQTALIMQRNRIGLEIFFKNSADIAKSQKGYESNDVTFAVETAYFRYSRSPFLRRPS